MQVGLFAKHLILQDHHPVCTQSAQCAQCHYKALSINNDLQQLPPAHQILQSQGAQMALTSSWRPS